MFAFAAATLHHDAQSVQCTFASLSVIVSPGLRLKPDWLVVADEPASSAVLSYSCLISKASFFRRRYCVCSYRAALKSEASVRSLQLTPYLQQQAQKAELIDWLSQKVSA